MNTYQNKMNLVRSFVALLLIPFSACIHFFLATKFEVYENKPIWLYIIFIACFVVLLRAFIKAKKHRAILASLNLFSWVLVLTLFWWIEVLSSYKTVDFPFSLNDQINVDDLTLVNTNGFNENVKNIINASPYTMFHFFRGYW